MKYILLIFTLILSACSVKSYEHTSSKIIIIKSPKLKFADLGYIRNSGKSVELELFVAGKAVEKNTLNHRVCTSEGCMDKRSFNKEYLSAAYPDDMLQNILLGRPIYAGLKRVQTADGFEQRVETQHVEITYSVNPHAIYFKDTKNKILINIKDMEQRR